MTDQDLAAVVEGIAPVVREYVSTALGDLPIRVKTVEMRASVQGPAGEPGARGEQGESGPVGPPGAVPDGLEARLVALETRSEPDQTDEALTACLTECLEKALSDLGPLLPLPRVQKRVIRDAHGRIERVVEEAVS